MSSSSSYQYRFCDFLANQSRAREPQLISADWRSSFSSLFQILGFFDQNIRPSRLQLFRLIKPTFQKVPEGERFLQAFFHPFGYWGCFNPLLKQENNDSQLFIWDFLHVQKRSSNTSARIQMFRFKFAEHCTFCMYMIAHLIRTWRILNWFWIF